MAYTLLGRIRPVYKGAWSSSAAYTALEMVKSADGRKVYMALKDVPAGTALTNAAYWAAVLDVSDVLNAADEAIDAAVARANAAAQEAVVAARLAPALTLTEAANPALIWPQEGSLLRPMIRVEPSQSGSGDPAPDNVRPVAGREEVGLTHGDTEYAIRFGQTVYGGTLDVISGTLSADRLLMELNGTEMWFTSNTANEDKRMTTSVAGILKIASNSAVAEVLCSHYPAISANYGYSTQGACGISQQANLTNLHINDAEHAAGGDVDAWKAYLAAQAAAGTPVQIVYRLAEPEVMQISPTEIVALAGENHIASDGDGLEVTYNKSLVREHEELTARLAALEAAAVKDA